MATFTPPTVDDVPAVLDRKDPAYNLFRHYAPRARGINVYICTDGTVTEDDSIVTDTTKTVAKTFHGGHTHTNVSAAHAALLTGAGYTVV
jgi:hypothetical protein